MDVLFSVLHCLFLAVFFVASLYVWNILPYFANRERDDPVSISCRFVSVFFVCLLSPFYVTYFIPDFIPFPIQNITLNNIVNSIIALIITMIWFLGPLVQFHYEIKIKYMFDSINKERFYILKAYYKELKAFFYSFTEIYIWRSAIIAPWSEEWVFRALMIPVLLYGGLDSFWAAFIAPLFFGVAHLHHIINFVFVEKKPFIQSLLRVSFQFLYTTIFGWYSAYLYIHSNTVLAPAIAHTFCNIMGFPDFGGINSYKSSTIIKIAYVIGLLVLV